VVWITGGSPQLTVDVMRHLKDYWFDFVELPQ
jgi:hypothetical protein